MSTVKLDSFLQRSGVTLENTTLARLLKMVPTLTSEGPWLAGGALRKTVLGQKPDTDFDFFFKNEEQLNEFARFLEDHGNATEIQSTEHAKTYLLTVPDDPEADNDVDEPVLIGKLTKPTKKQQFTADGVPGKTAKIQLIHFKFYANAAEVIDSFDFTLCQFAFDGETLTYADFALFDAARKRLVIHKITYPVSTMRRLLKYQQQGFYACTGCLTTILSDTIQSPELTQQVLSAEALAYID